MDRRLPTAVAVIVLVSVVASLSPGLGNATPHASEELNGLTPAERATLWSGDVDSSAVVPSISEPRDGTSANAETLHQLANVTDITFRRPPATAATWTRNDFREFEPGNESTSIAPAHATRTDSWAIQDAHATVFAIQPSTVVHTDGTRRRYVGPSGTLRGVIDYRIVVPRDQSRGNRTESWTLLEHDVEAVRVLVTDSVVARTDGTQTPQLDYELQERGRVRITLEAEINATIEKEVTVRNRVSGGAGTGGGEFRTVTRVETRTDLVTVRDTKSATVYDPDVERQTARSPDGTRAVAVTSTQPVRSYEAADGGTRIRSLWRFYTAREPAWDQLERHRTTGTTTIQSDSKPVVVHAFPAERSPRVRPYDAAPTITDVWGPTADSPAATIGSNVSVGAIEDAYTRPAGIAVRTNASAFESIQARGIVHGTTVDVEATSGPEQIRGSSLSVRVLEEPGNYARLLVELRDTETGDPIALPEGDTSNRSESDVPATSQGGYIDIAGERVRTNESGVATIRISRPGTYTAQFVPTPWIANGPSYTSDTATARWHPLTTIEGWLAFGSGVLARLLPLVVALYAGRHLGTFLRGYSEEQGWR